ncbi:MAG: hypothetical protein BGO49_14525 [Planctomycetales bacterium 71-10]|nr:MAG: hypothetical protein BGO49_14525 [Planctomycetales bacterium 71-10]
MAKLDEVRKVVARKALSRGISATGRGGYGRHVLLCVGANCCDGGDFREVEKRLNKRLSNLQKEGTYVYRTVVGCLNFCRGGPLMVVYPDGVWYHSVTPEVVDRIVDEHLVGGKVIEDHAFAWNPMAETPPANPAGMGGRLTGR